ncbi:MAG: PA0069 family radical SAM protein [Bdellovibrionaceae bacterium]|nr:PA0069 family radical SAM protein [Bdellovibrio sp.]
MAEEKNTLIQTIGRGAISNTTGRFESLYQEIDLSNYGWHDPEDETFLKTKFYCDTSKSILTENKSPDLPFRFSMNFYRGCEHGCIYCYARPTHEFLGLSAGLDFESKIFVKENAPALLREKFMSPRWQPESINISGVTDCYQPAERKFKLTRQCLEICAEFRNPVTLITKNHLITRDIDILKDLAKDNLVFTLLSITTLDAELGRLLEPRTSAPLARLQAIEELAQAGVPVGVNIAPVIPGLTEHEMPAILKAAAEAGAKTAGYVPVRLPYSVADLFTEWLEKNRPGAKNKILNSIRDLRAGKLNDPEFETRMHGFGPRADQMAQMFNLFSKKYGFGENYIPLSTTHFHRLGEQLNFFNNK